MQQKIDSLNALEPINLYQNSTILLNDTFENSEPVNCSEQTKNETPCPPCPIITTVSTLSTTEITTETSSTQSVTSILPSTQVDKRCFEDPCPSGSSKCDKIDDQNGLFLIDCRCDALDDNDIIQQLFGGAESQDIAGVVCSPYRLSDLT